MIVEMSLLELRLIIAAVVGLSVILAWWMLPRVLSA